MDGQKMRSTLALGRSLLLVGLVVMILGFQSTPASAQTGGCVNPLTGAACTDTPGPTCGLPGLPACNNPPPEIPTVRPTPRPTFTRTATPTVTLTPTVTPSPSDTITIIPTYTPNPSPTSKPISPLLNPITGLISLFHPPANVVELLPPWLQPDNLAITDVEITQGIQCLHNPDCPDNSVPLYSGKVTAVRVYVHLTTGPDYIVYPIGGALCYGNTGAGGCANPILPMKKIFVENEADPVSYGRNVSGTTLNFILPYYYTSSFSLQTLTVYVNYKFQDLPSEIYYKDNYKAVQYQVQESQPVYVKFYPVQDKGFFPPAGEFAVMTDYLAKVYPTGEFYPLLGIPLYGKNYDWTTPDSWGCPKGWHNLINDLWYLGGGSGPIAFGMVPYQSLSGGVIGCGVLGGPEAAGIAGDSKDGRVAAQEIGHTLNLPHVPGCGAGGPDLNYPKPNGLLDEVGFDPYTLTTYPTYSSYDFMGYCGGGTNSWTSIYTYNEIAGLLPAGVSYLPFGSPRTALIGLFTQPAKVLVGTGELSPTSATLTDGFYVIDRSTFKNLTPDSGPYSVELQDAGGRVLYSQHFDLAQMSNDNPQTQGGFRLILPWTDGSRKAVFKYQGKIIGQTLASAHAPTVKLTSPMGGESWAPTGQQTITWTAADADHNPLRYMIQYSADGGQTWMILAANLQDPTFTFDGDYLPGGKHGVIRVIATDGFNTTQVDSNQITVAPKAPFVSIMSPTDASTYDFGTPVVLQAVGTDLLDGAIAGGNFAWSSDRDGNLGTGSQLILTNLSIGAHTISLSVRNSSGLTATASVHIIINAANYPTVNNAAAVRNSLWLPILVIVVLIGLVVAAIFILRKRIQKA
jgi:hypothetical protein